MNFILNNIKVIIIIISNVLLLFTPLYSEVFYNSEMRVEIINYTSVNLFDVFINFKSKGMIGWFFITIIFTVFFSPSIVFFINSKNKIHNILKKGYLILSMFSMLSLLIYLYGVKRSSVYDYNSSDIGYIIFVFWFIIVLIQINYSVCGNVPNGTFEKK